ncbi:hypothetical protein KY285_030636 [Solanum tuberosum]|nr:hypothetical protein KY285_030636 [Solanum tuberosum]
MDKSSNPNGKIWIFWNAEVDCNILEADEQHITCDLQHVEYKEKFMTSFIYVKCKDHLRRSLHDRLIHFSNMNIPWCTIGDFNFIISIYEKQRGIPYNISKIFEFISVVEVYVLMDLGYNGQNFTWCTQRAEEAKVWKRLGRAMVNDAWLKDMPQTSINHLPSVESNHCPLLMSYRET